MHTNFRKLFFKGRAYAGVPKAQSENTRKETEGDTSEQRNS